MGKLTLPIFATLTGKIILLAVLYIATGKLGLLLAVPPGYATIIWPASGIAIGMLLLHGWRVWPGVFLGAFILNCIVSGAYVPEAGWITSKVVTALGIATGSTLQALLGRLLVVRVFGLPLSMHHVSQFFKLLLLCGPLACLVAASVGVVTLFLMGALPAADIPENWWTWWLGDMVGVIVFLPLVLVAPGHKGLVHWRGRAVGTLQVLSMLVLIMPLGLTLYSWKIVSENIHQQGIVKFASLALESEKALQHRVDSYAHALLGGVGFFEGMEHVTRESWREYVDTINIKKSFPGINGIGYVADVKPDELQSFIVQMRADDAPDFEVHPPVEGRPYYIIQYIEPFKDNALALGLNIGFENHRQAAAEKARDTGFAAITERITLVQDDEKTPGFLVLRPLYRQGVALNTQAERRAALRGWVYAPFIGKSFLRDLTASQGKLLNLKVYDGGAESPETLIYNSDKSLNPRVATHRITKQVDIMQHKWLLVWESTMAFEQAESSDAPLFILVGGLLFTGMFTISIMLLLLRRAETMEWMTEERPFLVPAIVFLVTALLSYYMYSALKLRELSYIKGVVEEQSQKIDQLISFQVSEKLLAIKRMAQRWEAAGGTSRAEWTVDAINYVSQIQGLRTVEWIDDSYLVRWVVPIKGNEKAVGLNIVFDDDRKQALDGAAHARHLTVTPPLDLVQGYTAFIVYAPIRYRSKFDGFIAGIFEVAEFLRAILADSVTQNYAVYLSAGGKEFYKNDAAGVPQVMAWGVEKSIQVQDAQWVLRVVPTQRFVQGQLSKLPHTILVGGLLIALLLSLTLRYILVARVKSAYLARSNKLNEAILSSAAYLIIATDKSGSVIVFNRAAEESLGWKYAEVVGKASPLLWHDKKELAIRAEELSLEFGMTVGKDMSALLIKPEKSGAETREWTFIRKDGTRFPVSLTVSPLRDDRGDVTGYLGVAENISERKRQQKALEASEETFRAAMHYAAIGMALVDLQGNWLRANPALCDILGYAEEDLLQTDFQSLTYPDDLDKDLENVQGLLEGRHDTYQIEKRYIHKSGEIVWAQLNVSMAKDSDNKPAYFIAQIRDITEQREMDRMKSEFISVVSHELRTPLTSIRGSLGLIEGTMAADVPEKVLNLLRIAHKNSERLILLINDILDLDKMNAGQMRFDMAREQVKELVSFGIESNAAYAEKFDVRLECDAVAEGLYVYVDAARWQQVFTNLISNAVKFSPEGGVVKISVTRVDGNIRFSVSDNGPGIPDEFAARIFTKFSQADSTNSRSKGGTGLGLNICREILSHMKGQIDFVTKEGAGTTFWFDLPAVNAYAGPDTEKDQKGQHLPVVLHVEDDEDLSEVIATGLAGKARVMTAGTLAIARQMIEDQDISVVIFDIGLPDGSGLSFIEYMHNRPFSLPPVLILAADEPPRHIRELVAGFMVKSRVSEDKVLDKIIELIGLSASAKGV
jgi:PAS domain S-box-containing protein